MIGEPAPVAVFVAPRFDDVHVTLKLVMASPPLEPAVKATATLPGPRVTPVTVGADGVAAAVKELDGADATLTPMMFAAVATHV